jgi:hypothetical protein
MRYRFKRQFRAWMHAAMEETGLDSGVLLPPIEAAATVCFQEVIYDGGMLWQALQHSCRGMVVDVPAQGV